MEFKQQDDSKHGSFYLEEGSNKLAEIDYTYANNDLLIIEHTEVDEKLKGKNIGYQLVDKVVEHARANHYKIIPLCPFAKAVFDKKPELKDVLR